MESIDKAWELLIGLPRLLNEYGTFSYPLLAVLLAGGLAILLWHRSRKRSKKKGLPAAFVIVGVALVFLSAGGIVLKGTGWLYERWTGERWVRQYRARDGEQRLFVFEFSFPATRDEAEHHAYEDRMRLMVGAIAQVLLEDLPDGFPQPLVVELPREDSPWRDGIGEQNFDDVIGRLNAFELMWGDVHPQGKLARTFLGLPRRLAEDRQRVIPLRDFAFEEDPGLEHQFGDGYYRLLGLVTLGMVLDTYHSARGAAGEERRALFLRASEQLRQARAKVNNSREDAILQRTLFSPNMDALIGSGLQEAGLAP